MFFDLQQQSGFNSAREFMHSAVFPYEFVRVKSSEMRLALGAPWSLKIFFDIWRSNFILKWLQSIIEILILPVVVLGSCKEIGLWELCRKFIHCYYRNVSMPTTSFQIACVILTSPPSLSQRRMHHTAWSWRWRCGCLSSQQWVGSSPGRRRWRTGRRR